VRSDLVSTKLNQTTVANPGSTAALDRPAHASPSRQGIAARWVEKLAVLVLKLPSLQAHMILQPQQVSTCAFPFADTDDIY
jgi:hypothetical protein